METPFIFGKIANEKNFTDREKETADLVQNFTSLINTIIISPRRWGKSSLVNKAAKLAMAQDSNLRICHIDLFNVRSEEHFYSLLAQEGHCRHFHKMGGSNRVRRVSFLILFPRFQSVQTLLTRFQSILIGRR